MGNAIVGHYVPNSDRRLWLAKFVLGVGSPNQLGDTILKNWVSGFNCDARELCNTLEGVSGYWVRLNDTDMTKTAIEQKGARINPFIHTPIFKNDIKIDLRRFVCKLGGRSHPVNFAYLFDLPNNALYINVVCCYKGNYVS